jgi:hypothetical protein
MTPLLERNEQFASIYTHGPLGPPTAQVLIVTCLDHRVDPAIVLGLQLGEAPVIRNAGGRVTQTVINDLAYLAFLAEQLFGGQDADGHEDEARPIWAARRAPWLPNDVPGDCGADPARRVPALGKRSRAVHPGARPRRRTWAGRSRRVIRDG